ncbi:MAG TPA: CRTAC1 family protein [Roseiflexaceae bacterium]|nr:CRTAC1 family protein [Roseiflexaceae bacterium]
MRAAALAWLLALLAAGCARAEMAANPGPLLAVSTDVRPFTSRAQPCNGAFVRHPLDHITRMSASDQHRVFDTNGAGLAANDLDNDGDIDLAFANLQGQNSIFWNQGGLVFQRQLLPHGGSRAVSAVDVDGDGWQDLVFTQRTERPVLWRNQGGEAGRARFAPAPLPGVVFPAYALAWGDLDGDTDLDLVTGSYDAALEQVVIVERRAAFGSSVGVYAYTNEGRHFTPRLLAPQAHALALLLADLDDDGAAEILVGNDFDTPDYAWTRREADWEALEPFVFTTRNTMSLDAGDLDNDGDLEIFATDMKPYDQSVATLARWLPMMQALPRPLSSGGPQINENVLQFRQPDGRYRNEAYERFAAATGWSWSGKFGDLNNDGFLDLYVVNGMLSADLLGYLPGGELVEENQALRNGGAGRFVREDAWGLGSRSSGRGMTMADLDRDGDLDIIINNLQAPAEVYENRLCGGAGLEVDLFWPQGLNTRAIGARLALVTSAGTYRRDVRATSGYLSGDPARVHFGLPAHATPHRLEITWPDGRVSLVESPPLALLAVRR